LYNKSTAKTQKKTSGQTVAHTKHAIRTSLLNTTHASRVLRFFHAGFGTARSPQCDAMHRENSSVKATTKAPDSAMRRGDAVWNFPHALHCIAATCRAGSGVKEPFQHNYDCVNDSGHLLKLSAEKYRRKYRVRSQENSRVKLVRSTSALLQAT